MPSNEEPDKRENILNTLLNKRESPEIRRATGRVRNLILEWYYQSPEGQAGLGYVHPGAYSAARKQQQ